jgi:hypothetical protein
MTEGAALLAMTGGARESGYGRGWAVKAALSGITADKGMITVGWVVGVPATVIRRSVPGTVAALARGGGEKHFR